MNQDVRIELFYAFYYLAKNNSFELAMKELNISRSTLYRKIKELETLLEGDLIANHRKGGVSLTPFGEGMFAQISVLINDLEIAQEKIVSSIGDLQIKKTIKIVTTGGFIALILVNAIAEYEKKIQDVSFEVNIINEEFIPEKHVFDIAFFPEMFLNKQKYLVENMGNIKLHYFASKTYIEEHGEPQAIKDLENHNVLKFHLDEKETRGPTDWMFFENKIGGRPKLMMNSLIARLFAVMKGYGIASLPSQINKIFDLKLVLLKKIPKNEGVILAITPRSKYQQTYVKDFFDFTVSESREFLSS